MKLLLINIVLFSFGSFINAQVGINTKTPNAAFDVEVNPNIPIDQDIVGVKIPIVSKQQLGNKTVYGTNHKGTMIFVDGLDYTGNNPSVANIEDNKYFYIFNGNTWKSSVYTLSGSGYIIQSTNEQGFINSTTPQPIKLFQTGDLIIPENSTLFNHNEYDLTANETGMYAISGYILFRPRPASDVDKDTQSLAILSVDRQRINSSGWETISSTSKYFYGHSSFLGLTIPIAENILDLNQGDKIRLTVTIPNYVNGITMNGFFPKNTQSGGTTQGDNISILVFKGGTGGDNIVQKFSRNLSLQKL